MRIHENRLKLPHSRIKTKLYDICDYKFHPGISKNVKNHCNILYFYYICIYELAIPLRRKDLNVKYSITYTINNYN